MLNLVVSCLSAMVSEIVFSHPLGAGRMSEIAERKPVLSGLVRCVYFLIEKFRIID